MKTKILFVSTLVLPLFCAVSILISQNLRGEACNGKTPNGVAPQECDTVFNSLTSGCERWTSNCRNHTGLYYNPGFQAPISSGCENGLPNIEHCVIKTAYCGYFYKCKPGANSCTQGNIVVLPDPNNNNVKVPQGPTIAGAYTPSCGFGG